MADDRGRAAGDDPRALDGELAQRLRRMEAENARLQADVQRLEKSRKDLENLSSRILAVDGVSQEFNTLDLERIAAVATRRIPEIVGARSCSLFLYDYDADELHLKSHTHTRSLSPRISVPQHRNSMMAQAMVARRPLNVSTFAEFEKVTQTRVERPFADHYGSEACLSVPLKTANFLVGVLNFSEKTDRSYFDEASDLPAVEHLSRMLAMAIRNCNLFKDVQTQAHTDALTKLRNYRAFQEVLRSEMHRCTRYGRPLGMVMLDVDTFKQINDTHGHPAGDYALREIAQIVLRTVRREDLAARYGGDEIALLLPETSPKGCVRAVERLLERVRAHDFVFEGRALPVTLSAGVAFHAPEQSVAGFVGAADRALYQAKEAGRNRFVVAE